MKKQLKRSKLNRQLQDGLAQVPGLGTLTGPERALIRVLAIAQRSSIDPGPMVIALSQEFSGQSSKRLQRLGSALIDRMHVIDAIASSPGTLGNSHLVALRLADQAGKLPEMYDALLTAEILPDEQQNEVAGIGSEFLRLVLTVLFAWFILTFVSIWIMPTFEQMFEEFGIDLPPMTLLLFAMIRFVPLIGALMVMLAMAYLLWHSSIAIHWLSNRFFPSRFGKVWQPPTAKLRSLLALIPELELPIEDGLATIIKAPGGYRTKRRLELALTQIRTGKEPWTTLASQNLIRRREAEALSAAETPAAESWILGQLAQRRTQTAWGRRQRQEQIFAVANTLVLGFIVAWASISTFMVLFDLIAGLA